MKSANTEAQIRGPVGRPSPLPTRIPTPLPGGGGGGIHPASSSPPGITGTTPQHTTAGMPVAINGSNFENVQVVQIGREKVAGFSVASPSLINTTVPANLTPGPATIDVTTKLDDGSTSTAEYTGFVVDLPIFKPSAYAPNAARVGETVTIFGSGLTRTTRVLFNGVSAMPITIVDDTKITVKVPDGATSGPITVSDGPDTVQLPGFMVIPEPPVINSFKPTQGIVGTTVQIFGKHLAPVTRVFFNNTEVPKGPGLQTGLAQVITAYVPTGATTGPIKVQGPTGSASSATDFIVIQKPVLDNAAPPSGRVGDKVVLNGHHLGEVTSMNFGGVIVMPPAFKDKSEKKIRTNVPAGVPLGPVTITVTNDAGTSPPLAFTVTA